MARALFDRCCVSILLASLLPVAAGAEAEERFDAMYRDFVEERNQVSDGQEARAFLDRITALLPPEDEQRAVQQAVVACFYGTLDDLNEQRQLGESAHLRALAAGLYREAGLLRICHAHALEMLEGSSQALPLFRDALALIQRSGDRYSEAVASFWLGSALSVLGSVGEALAQLLDAQIGFEALGRPDRARVLDIDIAILYRRIGRLDRAEEMLRAALAEMSANPDAHLEDQLTAVFQLAAVLNAQQRWEEALDSFAEAEARLGDRDLPTWQRTVTAGPASTLNALGRHQEALDRLDRAMALHAEAGGIALTEIELERAGALVGLGRTETAIEVLDQLIQTSAVTGSPTLSLDWHLVRADALHAADRLEEAYQHMLEARRLDRVLQAERNAQQLTALQSVFENRERARALEQAEGLARLKQAEIEALQQTRTWQSLALLVLGALLFALVLWGTQQRGQRRKMSELAHRDPLTGLANRRGFLDRAERVVAGRHPDCTGPALLAIDLDHFKTINDGYGHPVGDRVLIAIAAVLRASARSGDLTGRLGGEEFAMMLPRASSHEAFIVAERLRQTVAQTRFDDLAAGLRLSCSIGIASVDEPGVDSFGELMVSADRRLYRAKAAGRNRVVSSDEPLSSGDADTAGEFATMIDATPDRAS